MHSVKDVILAVLLLFEKKYFQLICLIINLKKIIKISKSKRLSQEIY